MTVSITPAKYADIIRRRDMKVEEDRKKLERFVTNKVISLVNSKLRKSITTMIVGIRSPLATNDADATTLLSGARDRLASVGWRMMMSSSGNRDGADLYIRKGLFGLRAKSRSGSRSYHCVKFSLIGDTPRQIYIFPECAVCESDDTLQGYRCGHNALCSSCFSKTKECPICRHRDKY